MVWSGGGGGRGGGYVLWLILHNDYKICQICKKVYIQWKICLIKLTIIYSFFIFWSLK